ncbi:MAG: hypothetical protein NVSMB56_12810 [Pyrinomonadaceae bacterium]
MNALQTTLYFASHRTTRQHSIYAVLLFTICFVLLSGASDQGAHAQTANTGRIITSTGCSPTGIIAINPDGSNRINLAPDTFANGCTGYGAYNSSNPSVARNGMIAFQSTRNQHGENPFRQFRIYVMNADGSNVRRLTPEPAAGDFRPDQVTDFNPAISPDGSRVAFISNRTVIEYSSAGTGGNTVQAHVFDIYIVNTDGTGLRKVTTFQLNPGNGPLGSDFRSVTWSPDGTRLAFRALRQIPDKSFRDILGAINPDGTGETLLSQVNSDGSSLLDWSPDGTRIMHGQHPAGNDSTFFLRYYSVADGSITAYRVDASPFNFNSGDYAQARFSPDSQRIVYFTVPDPGEGTRVLVTANLDLSNITTVGRGIACGAEGVAWAAGANIGTPARLDLIPAPISVYAGGPSVQLTPILYDANNNVLSRSVQHWEASGCNTRAPVLDDQGLLTPTGYTPSFTDQICAVNAGLRTCVDVLGNPTTNPIDTTDTYVRQQYADFLNRAPDASGLAFWKNEIISCNGNAQCIDTKRTNVSAAYFLSREFQETGFYVIKLQRAAFGKVSNDATKRITFQQFASDASTVGNGFVDGQAGADQKLDQNKTAYTQNVVTNANFIARFPTSQTATQFVDALYQSAGVTPQGTERQDATNAFGGGDTAGRAAALRKVAESNSIKTAEFNSAFVLLQYFGYLRRNPTDAPDTNDSGYQFWLNKLTQFNGDYIKSEMVRSFIVSSEYRKRFGTQ